MVLTLSNCKCAVNVGSYSTYTIKTHLGGEDSYYPARNPSAAPSQVTWHLCFGIPLGTGMGEAIPLEYSLSSIPRAGSSQVLLLDNPPCFKTCPWSDPQAAFSYISLSLGQAPVPRTFSRICRQKRFLVFPRNSSCFPVHPYLDRFEISSPSLPSPDTLRLVRMSLKGSAWDQNLTPTCLSGSLPLEQAAMPGAWISGVQLISRQPFASGSCFPGLFSGCSLALRLFPSQVLSGAGEPLILTFCSLGFQSCVVQ